MGSTESEAVTFRTAAPEHRAVVNPSEDHSLPSDIYGYRV
jgi:hypothetical protein